MEKSANIFQNKLLKLNNGKFIPAIGLGTYQIKSDSDITRTLTCAFETGYKHIDSAQIYRNEKFIGDYLNNLLVSKNNIKNNPNSDKEKNEKVKREDIFITSKISTKNMTYAKAKNSIIESLKKFSLDYIDLMLIHWPEAKSLEDRYGVWQALEEAVFDKKIISIGVSNFLPMHLKSILDNPKLKIKPVVNQIEVHPLFIDYETINFCKQNNIQIQAYCPIGRMHEKLQKNDLIISLARKYKKSIPQLLIRWSLQNDLCVLVKSINENRIKENFDIDDFEIEEEDIKIISGLNCDFKISWDPRRIDKF